jgi:hypothetical protein
VDAVVAFTVNAGAVLTAPGDAPLDSRVTVRFDWGQNIEEGNGLAKFEVRIVP